MSDHDSFDALPAAVVATLRHPVRPARGRDAALAAIMGAVHAAPAPASPLASAVGAGAGCTARGRVMSLRPMRPRWSLRRGTLSPAGALLAASLAVLTVWLGGAGRGRRVAVSDAAGRPIETAAAGTFRDSLLDNAFVLAIRDSLRVVRFALDAPGASRVALVAEFAGHGWRAVPLRRVAGVWSAELPVRGGRHRYGYVVDDDRWAGTNVRGERAVVADTVVGTVAPLVVGDTI